MQTFKNIVWTIIKLFHWICTVVGAIVIVGLLTWLLRSCYYEHNPEAALYGNWSKIDSEDGYNGQVLPHQYPWEDVALSLLHFPDRVTFDYDRCPVCGDSRIRLYFHSPEATWAMMCGIAGYMTICPQCQIQAEFNQTMRN